MRRRLIAVIVLGLALGPLGCIGTGSPWTKVLRVAVVQNTQDGQEQIPIPGALVTVTRGAALGGGGTGTGTGTSASWSLGTDGAGVAVFRLEPGYSYTVSVTAAGFRTGSLTLEIGHLANQTITRRVVLVPGGTP